MAVITISRGSYSRGKEVAEKLADKLGYACVSREILLEASEEFNIPELRLSKALHDSPSILERFQHGKVRYMSYYRYALLKHVQRDNVVYHGLAGQYFLRSIPHVFKVRIIANLEDRIQEEMKRDNISKKKALRSLLQDDEERRKWGQQLYGIDTWDSRLYDMVLNINRLTVDDAVHLLHEAAQKPIFQTTSASQGLMNDQTLAAKIHAILVNYSLMVEVHVKDGVACLSNIGDVLRSDNTIRARIEQLVGEVEGIEQVKFMDPATSKMDYVNPFHNLDSH